MKEVREIKVEEAQQLPNSRDTEVNIIPVDVLRKEVYEAVMKVNPSAHYVYGTDEGGLLLLYVYSSGTSKYTRLNIVL